MSFLTFNTVAQPSAPASGKAVEFVDSTTGRPMVLASTGVLSQLSGQARYNWVRNGGLWLAQRQAPGTLTTYGATTARAIYGADGWSGWSENASAQFIRTDVETNAPETGLQSGFYGQFTKITSAGKMMICQILEGKDAAEIRGRTVRVQIWAKFIVGNAGYRLGLIQLNSAGTIDVIPSTAGNFITVAGANGTDPTLGTNLTYIAPKSGVTGDNCTVNGNAADVTLTSAWQRFGAVFDVPTNCKNLLVAIWSNAQITATNGCALSQASLTDGYEIQDWSPQAFEVEALRVQRFYQKTFTYDQSPVQNAVVNTGEAEGIAGKAGAVANAGFIHWRYPTPLRAAPTTTTLYNPAAANALERNITGAADMGATVAFTSTAQGTGANATGVAATAVGDRISIHFSVDAEL